MQSLHIIDWAIIFIYLIGCLVIGLYKSRKIKNIKGYALGAINVPTGVLVSTIFATHIGAGSSIGIVEQIFALGLIFVVSQIISPVFWLVSAWIFGRNIEKFRSCLSLSDIMDKLYGKPGRWVANFASLFISIGVIAIQMTAMGFVLNYFMGVSHFTGIIIGLATLVIYTAFGGARIVALTDVFQFAVFFIAIPMACIFALKDIGGFNSLLDKIPAASLDFDLGVEGNLWLFLSLLIYSFIPDTSGAFVQRFLMARSAKQLYTSLKVIALLSLFLELTMCLLSFIILVKSPGIDPSLGFIHFIGNYLSIGIKGLMVAALLAVFMSTADSFLNNASIICSHDIIKKIIPSITDKQELQIARISVLVLSLCSILLALSGKRILELIWLVDCFWQPLILIPLSAGFLNFRTNSKSFIAASSAAIIFTCIGAYLSGGFATISMVTGLIGSSLGLFGMHYYQLTRNKIYSNYFSLLWLTKGRQRLLRTIQSLKAWAVYFAHINYVSFTQKKVNQYGARYYLFSFLGLIQFLSSLCICLSEKFASDDQSLFASVFLIAIVLAFSFSFHEFLSTNKFKKYLPVYWYLSLLICLPLLGSFILFCNPHSTYGIINFIFSILLLAIFVDYQSFIMLTVVGVLLSKLIMFLVMDNILYLSTHGALHSYIYSALPFLVAIFIKRSYELRLANVTFLCGAIAHEITTPLSVISMQANSIVEDQKQVTKIKKSIIRSVNMTQNIINSVLMNLKNTDSVLRNDEILISQSINDAIKSLACSNEEERAIQLVIRNDFLITCNKLYITNMIVNLLKNSLYYLNTRKDFRINILVFIEGDKKIVNVIDNGPGISNDDIEKVFDTFYTKKVSGTGIGLAFCKKVMECHGGSISCISSLGEYTKIELRFA